MKKIVVFMAVLFLSLTLAGCRVTTITEQAGNYVYAKDEEILILDIETRDTLGVLKMTGTEILISDPFVIKERAGSDKDGHVVYEDVTYAQLIQVFYSYDNRDSAKKISSQNFYVYDGKGISAKKDPKIDCSPKKRNGEAYFLVAVKNAGGFLDLQFQYNPMQLGHTANIRLDIPHTNTVSTTNSPPETTTSTTTTATESNPQPTQGETTATETLKPDTNHRILVAAVAVLSMAVILLSVVLIVLLYCRKHPQNSYTL